MKKILILFFGILVALGLSSLKGEKPEKYKVAILTPTTHPSLEQIEKGFVEKLDPQKYVCKTFNALGNKSLLRSEIEEIAHGKFDLVFTIAVGPSQMAKEVFEKKGIKTPIVFTAVPAPLKLGLVHSETSSKNQLTGVKEITHFAKQLEVLKARAKSVLLVYDPTSYSLEEDKKEVESILKAMNIQMKVVEIFKSSEILSKAAPFIDDVDAVLVIKDNTVVSGIDALVKLCNQKRKLLIASDLDSGDKGVPLVYGVSERIYGEESAKMAMQILEEKKSPQEIPISAPPDRAFHFKIDPKRLQALGFPPELFHD